MAEARIKPVYEPAQIEQSRYREWEASGCFSPIGKGSPYCIVIPPPNVTGTLHMGHAFQVTLMDSLVRYNRMRGLRTLWQPGTDHAGIATQMVVERQLEASGLSRSQMSREQFIAKVWEWKKTSGDTINRQLRRLGASLDWRREKFTMDEQLSTAVLEAFVRLYDEGLIYRAKRLINWDPKLKTAVSDLEVIPEEINGHLWHIRYPLNGGGHITVATTRPETLFGDTAVAVHPEDERYSDLVGQRLSLPLSEREIPVIADRDVDPEFGSGCVKITPAHDFKDYAIGRRHGLEMINIMHEDASLNDAVPAAYRGLNRYVARERVVDQLQRLGLLDSIEDYRMTVPRGDRSGEIIEPYLTDQWFVRATKLAKAARQVVADGHIRFTPEHWKKNYFEWLDNIEDWCISRQLWWGHRIPAWYNEKGEIYVGRNEYETREKYQLGSDCKLQQDHDVLDTWFSSSLWPFSTLGWPESTAELQDFYPTSILVTGFDIIFFWVARMVMMGIRLTDEIPFREVYVHGLVRDNQGQKMSKSKGNILDPIDLIDGITLEKLVQKRLSGLMQPRLAKKIERDTHKQFADGIPSYGADALRFTFAAMATSGRDIRFDLGRIGGYRNFCNKLWNAARFVSLTCDSAGREKHVPGTIYERWIRHRLNALIENVAHHFSTYRFDLLSAELYEFVWHDFCDWFLEFTKVVQQEAANGTDKASGHTCLVETLETTLRLLHPVMPHITEELWQQLKPLSGLSDGTIQQRPYPVSDPAWEDPLAEQEVAQAQQIIAGLRRIRSELCLPPGKPLPVLIQGYSEQQREHFNRHQGVLYALGGIQRVDWLPEEEKPPQAAIALIGEMKLLVPLAGLVNAAAEIVRLEKQIARINKQLAQAQARLNNESFITRAPKELVAAQRDNANNYRMQLDRLSEQISVLETL